MRTPTTRVHALLSKPVKKADRIKSSFALDRQLFEGFKTLCEERQLTQSEVLEALLEDLLTRYSIKESVEA
jgi:hypothetical protein